MVNLLQFLSMLLFLLIPASSQLDQLLYGAGFKDAGPHLTLNEGAEIEKNGILKFTNETSKTTGYAFYPYPFHFKNSSNGKVFSFSSSFALATVPLYPNISSSGLAFIITTSSDTANFPKNHPFSVKLETFKGLDHIEINIYDYNLKSHDSATEDYDNSSTIAKQDLDAISGIPFLAWVDYDSAKNVVSVTLSPSSSKPKKPFTYYDVDLSPFLNESMYVGISAPLDLLPSSRYILGWSFKINGPAPPLDLSSLPKLLQQKKWTSMIAAVSVTVVVIAAIFIGIYLFRIIKNADVIEDWELEIGPHRYSYQELKKATNGFKDKELLGQGGFGKVYKGTLPNSETQVAVKRISHGSKQGLREFVSEIASIGRVRHRNLVQLLGWCRRGGDLLLVYDFMANGSLDKYLFGKSEATLSWEQRFKIIKDVASSLLYLHEGYEQVVIHRDVKAGNVLLDSELNGRLGDFGLARLYEHGANPSTTIVVGTFGYLAPELYRTGKATPSSDVFAFGALLVEVACGLRPIEPKKLPEDIVLVDWVWKRYKEGRILDVVDPKLNDDFDEREVLLVLKLGLMCSNGAPTARPDMKQVVRFLHGENGLPDELKKPREIGQQEGFDGFLHSLESSSFDKMSPSSSIGNRHVHASFPYFVNLPIFTPSGRGETW